MSYKGQSAIKTLNQQVLNMKSVFRDVEVRFSNNGSTITLIGTVRPTARSIMYTYSLAYSNDKAPCVKIIAPLLIRNEKNEDIPHMYDQINLCLYRPIYQEFNSTMYLSKTIIPWITLWLYHYEGWHTTGSWNGGGEHP